jgi:hypothetical protein
MSLLLRAALGERWRKGTKTDYRYWFWHCAMLPLVMLITLPYMDFILDHWPIWAVIAVIAVLGAVYVFISLSVAPKVPSPVLITIAVVSWAALFVYGWKKTGVL